MNLNDLHERATAFLEALAELTPGHLVVVPYVPLEPTEKNGEVMFNVRDIEHPGEATVFRLDDNSAWWYTTADGAGDSHNVGPGFIATTCAVSPHVIFTHPRRQDGEPLSATDRAYVISVVLHEFFQDRDGEVATSTPRQSGPPLSA